VPDQAYVTKLAQNLIEAGIPVWFDREIITGQRWVDVIEHQIDTCAAVLVVMTPDARTSEWVDREIDQAEKMGKPIYPVLLRGERFFRLANLQYEDVTDLRMPSHALLSELARLLRPKHEAITTTPTPSGPEQGQTSGTAPAAPQPSAVDLTKTSPPKIVQPTAPPRPTPNVTTRPLTTRSRPHPEWQKNVLLSSIPCSIFQFGAAISTLKGPGTIKDAGLIFDVLLAIMAFISFYNLILNNKEWEPALAGGVVAGCTIGWAAGILVAAHI
jgi:hypothetical protein